MIKNVNHVFVGDLYGVQNGKQGQEALVFPEDIKEIATNPAYRECVFVLDIEKPLSGQVVTDYSTTVKFRIARFANPSARDNSTELIVSPLLTRGIDFDGCISPPQSKINWGAFDTLDAWQSFSMWGSLRPIQKMCLPDNSGDWSIRTTVKFKDIWELSPGQKYTTIHTQVPKTQIADDGSIISSLEVMRVLCRQINDNPYLRKFLFAEIINPDPEDETANEDYSLHVETREVPYTVDQRYPNYPVVFSISIDAVHKMESGKREPLRTSGAILEADDLDFVMGRRELDVLSPIYAMEAEKNAQGYMGVTNITVWPVLNDPFRTDLRKSYFPFTVNIKRPYQAADLAQRTSFETLSMFLAKPSYGDGDLFIECINNMRKNLFGLSAEDYQSINIDKDEGDDNE